MCQKTDKVYADALTLKEKTNNSTKNIKLTANREGYREYKSGK